MRSFEIWKVAGRGSLLVILLLSLLWWSVSACDREREDSSSPDDDESTLESPSDDDGYAEASSSAYDALEDVEPMEPQDVGPEAGAIYFLSGLKGYTEPCGCTVDVLLGGIDRATAFVKDARKLHPDALFVDAGDWMFEHDDVPEHFEPQESAKAEVLADAYRHMGALFSVPGNRDLALGSEFYLSMMEKAEMEPLGANISFGEEALRPSMSVELDGQEVLFVAAGDPSTYEGVDGVEVGDDRAAIEQAVGDGDADVVILVFQGNAIRAGEIVEEVEGIDFVIVGHEPRKQRDAQPLASSYLLEAYDQGRYVGRLKLYAGSDSGRFVDGRAGIREQRDALDQQIEQIRLDVRRLEVRTDGEPTPIMERLRERLKGLEERRQTLLSEGIEIPSDHPAFLYDLIALEPGYRLDETMRQRREDYNRSLAELNANIDRDVIPVSPGEPFFVGTPKCATCHFQAHDFWEGTAHASAVATLEERHKEFDQNCIGCHVDGWEQPGGSVLGKISYEAELGGETFTKDLSEVGCESCHGAGSKHVLDPVGEGQKPQHIDRFPGEDACTQCHVPDHSPSFDFDVYVERITGEGHELSGRD